MSDEIYESPILKIGRRMPGVVFHGRLMKPATAQRIKELAPALREAAAECRSITEVARRIGYSLATVRSWCNLLGIEVKRKPACGTRLNTNGWYQVIMAGIAEGLTQEEIGAKLGVHSMQICRYCRRNKINWRYVRHNHIYSRGSNVQKENR